jgi:hypothetical protein
VRSPASRLVSPPDFSPRLRRGSEISQLEVRHEGQRLTAVAESLTTQEVAFAILTDRASRPARPQGAQPARAVVAEHRAGLDALARLRRVHLQELEQVERVEENAPSEIIVTVCRSGAT